MNDEGRGLDEVDESLQSQVDRLAEFFLKSHPRWIGEGGAIDNAIFRLQKLDEALRVARAYVLVAEGSWSRPNVVTPDRELCDRALGE